MAFFNRTTITFDNNIRLVLCAEGFFINNDFIPREIGFWTTNNSGSIPIRCRINPKKLSNSDKDYNDNLIRYHHGIKFTNQVCNSLVRSEIKGILLTLYNMCKSDDDPERIYIGVIGNISITSLLCYCGLGHLIVDLSKLEPYNKIIEEYKDFDLYYEKMLNLFPDEYKTCKLHSDLTTALHPLCAGAFAKVIGNFGFRKQNWPTWQENMALRTKDLCQ